MRTSPVSGRQRRILLGINDLEYGGAEQQLVHLATRLKACGHHVAVVTLLPADDHAPALRALDVPLIRIEMSRLRGASAVRQARAIVRQQKPDLIITFLYQSNMVMRLASVGLGIPVISSIRNEYFGGRARETAMRISDSLAVRTVTNSRLAAKSLLSRGVVPESKLLVIPNGLPLDQFATAATRRDGVRAALGLAPDHIVWLGIGRLWPQKNWAVLVDAVSTLPADVRSRLRVLIVGDGYLEAELRLRIDRQGLADRIQLLGRRPDVPDLLGACDALILTSDFEGLPNVVIEAMAASRPVVATAVGGSPELVEDGSTGVLVPPADVSAVAKAMTKLSRLSAPERAAMGERGRAAVQERYALDAVMAQWQALVDETLQNGNGRLKAAESRSIN
ncbi:MAG: glycosyltransferase [Actinomycetes bacterium]